MPRLTTDQYVATQVDTLTRREGDVVTFEVMDRLDPVQRESAIVLVESCSCELTPEHTAERYCSCGAAAKASALTADLRKRYATAINLNGRVA